MLKSARPGVEVHLLANDYNAWVAKGNPHVDRLWVYRRVRHGVRVSIGAAWDWLWKLLALRRERCLRERFFSKTLHSNDELTLYPKENAEGRS